ncbi:hypothetical protein J7J69_01160 [candidate division WOR-3 bacterium]|nr:hypothetical protein [candidate division WOR-3 bacterium]
MLSVILVMSIFNIGNPAEINFMDTGIVHLNLNFYTFINGRDTTHQIGSLIALFSNALGIQRNLLYTGEPFAPIGISFIKKSPAGFLGFSYGYSRSFNNTGDTLTSSSGMLSYGQKKKIPLGIKFGYVKSSEFPYLGHIDIVPYLNIGFIKGNPNLFGGNILYFSGYSTSMGTEFRALQGNLQWYSDRLAIGGGYGKLSGTSRNIRVVDDVFHFISSGYYKLNKFSLGEDIILIKEFYTEDHAFGTYNQNSAIIDINLLGGLNLGHLGAYGKVIFQSHKSQADIPQYSFNMITSGIEFSFSGIFGDLNPSIQTTILSVDPDRDTDGDEFKRLMVKLYLSKSIHKYRVKIVIHGTAENGENTERSGGGIAIGVGYKGI